MSLAGKHAIVTGGVRGIGHAAAELLARQGARVSVVSRSVAPAEVEPFFAAQADVTDEEQIHRAFDACRKVNGPIAILVNSSGVAESARVTRTPRAMWDRIVATNLTGTFLCTREALQDMMAAGWGRIVNVASTAGLVGAPYIAAYCASKHGVVGFTRAVAAEYAAAEITINAVCPGYTESDMLCRAIANIAEKTGRTEAAARELLANGNPEGRIATTQEVADAILELINDSRTGLAVVIPTAKIVSS
ncbi:MAG TPA: SDR family NAD(P)-dependent oxidoreductase [Candidatus Cybelea sp.]|nr:SDR family NAD(P)-dependent oxidoreductase [Candidatus Cybelea sp.]